MVPSVVGEEATTSSHDTVQLLTIPNTTNVIQQQHQRRHENRGETVAVQSPVLPPSSSSMPIVPPQQQKQQRRRRKHRSVPYPNTILDTVQLIQTLESMDLYGTTILPMHIIALYQALHRQHYPTLPEFVDNYYMNEQNAQQQRQQQPLVSGYDENDSNNNNNDDVNDEPNEVTTSKTEGVITSDDNNNRPSHHQQRRRSRRRIPQQQQPLKNLVSTSKNYNRMQLPKPFLEFLRSTRDYVTVTSTVHTVKTSSDHTTTKLVIQLHDAQIIESVIMRYHRPNKKQQQQQTGDGKNNDERNLKLSKSKTGYGNGRASLCVSSQCGCAMGCTFCATGTMGLSGNLSTGEILEQIIHADRILANEWNDTMMKQQQQQPAEDAIIVRHGNDGNNNHHPPPKLAKLDLIRNVVFMGMGEPLDNYDNVVAACRALTDNRRWNIAHTRVTISTVGIVDKIRKLTEDMPEVNLAVSLHAPNQDMRTSIVPSAKQYPIEALIDALDNHMMTFVARHRQRRQIASNENPQNGEYDTTNNAYTVEERTIESTRRRAMVEYVMLEGPTSSIEAAHQLGQLCEGRQLVVNLIPYNQTDVRDQLRCPSEDHMQSFRNIVSSYGTFCTIRRTMGADIDSACGQLVTLENTRSKSRHRSTDIEDVGEALIITGVSKNYDGGNNSNIGHNSTGSRRSMTMRNGSTSTTNASSVPDDGLDTTSNLDRWIQALTIATIVSATCFIATTSGLLLHRQRR